MKYIASIGILVVVAALTVWSTILENHACADCAVDVRLWDLELESVEALDSSIDVGAEVEKLGRHAQLEGSARYSDEDDSPPTATLRNYGGDAGTVAHAWDLHLRREESP